MSVYRPRVYDILKAIDEHPRICRKDLAEVIGVKTQSATIGRGLNDLIEGGLILKDRRTIGARTAYYITEKGGRVLAALAVLEAAQ